MTRSSVKAEPRVHFRRVGDFYLNPFFGESACNRPQIVRVTQDSKRVTCRMCAKLKRGAK